MVTQYSMTVHDMCRNLTCMVQESQNCHKSKDEIGTGDSVITNFMAHLPTFWQCKIFSMLLKLGSNYTTVIWLVNIISFIDELIIDFKSNEFQFQWFYKPKVAVNWHSSSIISVTKVASRYIILLMPCIVLSYCELVMPYGNKGPGQHWLG